MFDPLGYKTVNYNMSCNGPWPGPRVIKLSFDDCTKKRRDDLADRMCKTFRAAGQSWLDVYKLEQRRGTAQTRRRANRWLGGTSGTVTNRQLDKIEEVLWAVFRAFDGRIGIECECKCDTGVNAYVYRVATDIHICPNFWTHTNRTQSAILFHELTHEYGGTTDYGYVTGWGAPPTYGKKQWTWTGWTPTRRFLPIALDTGKLIYNADTYEEFVKQYYIP